MVLICPHHRKDGSACHIVTGVILANMGLWGCKQCTTTLRSLLNTIVMSLADIRREVLASEGREPAEPAAFSMGSAASSASAARETGEAAWRPSSGCDD